MDSSWHRYLLPLAKMLKCSIGWKNLMRSIPVIGDPLLNIDPGFASFHGEPRFRSLVAKLALQMPEDNPEQFREKLPEIFLRGKYAR